MEKSWWEPGGLTRRQESRELRLAVARVSGPKILNLNFLFVFFCTQNQKSELEMLAGNMARHGDIGREILPASCIAVGSRLQRADLAGHHIDDESTTIPRGAHLSPTRGGEERSGVDNQTRQGQQGLEGVWADPTVDFVNFRPPSDTQQGHSRSGRLWCGTKTF